MTDNAEIKITTDRYAVRAVRGTEYVEYTTLFTDRDGDHIQLYTKALPDGFYATDGGLTLDRAEERGFDIQSPRAGILRTAIANMGVCVSEEELYIIFSAEEFPEAFNLLLEAVLLVEFSA